MENPHPSPAPIEPTSDVIGPLRLWTPWRMEYVGGGAGESGCVFCNRLAGTNDVASLIVHRADRAFVMMNLFPYNTGHMMIVPNAHTPSPEEADPATLAAIGTLQKPILRGVRRALGCDGFNLGSNIGTIAGAGIAAHFHHHVVPRWIGDANFMPVLAATKALPELIPISYAKLRADIARELKGELPEIPVTAVALSTDGTRVLIERNDGAGGWRLPTATPDEDEACWRAARRSLGGLEAESHLVGWAGETRADTAGPIALTFQVLHEPAARDLGSGRELVPLAEAQTKLDSADDRAAVTRAVANLAPG